MADLQIIQYRKDSKSFLDDLREDRLPNAVQYDLESRYRKAEIGEGFDDLSFIVTEGKNLKACVLCHKYGQTTAFNGSGAEITFLSDESTAIKNILDKLNSFAIEHKLPSFRVADMASGEVLSALGSECYNRNGTPRYALRALIDLTQSEETLHANLRKSYKSLVNKGRAEMQFKAITKDNPDETAFRQFEDFHLKTAGRKTRSNESWNVQFDMIKAGEAELLMGYLEPHGLVSSALFTDFGPVTSYAVAVYDRDLFDKPLAHANVYEGMIRAKNRGKTAFNLGIMPMPGEASEKELNIAKFKKGFVPSLTGLVEWTIPVEDNT